MKEEGLTLKIACDKLVNLCISSLCITEYNDESLGIVHTSEELPPALTKNEAVPYGEKPALETCISRLPKQIQNEIMNMDSYLTAQRAIKFKRQIEKNGNKITYVASDHGFSYAIYLSNDYFDHSLQWYLITSGKPETWHRKADQMEETLSKLEQDDPHFAKHMYGNLEDCVGCYQTCLARTRYRFNGQEKTTCHGKLKFKADLSGFEDVRRFLAAISSIVKEPQAKSMDKCEI
jgi:hypothetical protein